MTNTTENTVAGKAFRIKKQRPRLGFTPPSPKACHACYRPHTHIDIYCLACLNSGKAWFHQTTAP